MPVAHDDRIQHRVFIERKVVLAQHGHPFAGRDFQAAAGAFYFAGEHFQEGGFTGPVRADHAVTVAFDKFKTDVVEKHTLAKLHGHIIYGEHLWKKLSIRKSSGVSGGYFLKTGAKVVFLWVEKWGVGHVFVNYSVTKVDKWREVGDRLSCWTDEGRLKKAGKVVP